MEDYIFHEGLPPQGYKPDFEFALFNSEKHLLLQTTENWHSYSVLHKKYNLVSAIIYINISDNVAQSPLRNPFGSYEIAPDLSPIILFQFLDFVEARLKAKGIHKIKIKEAPSLYNPDRAAVLHSFLFNNGYHISDAEIGAIVSINEQPFWNYPKPSEKARLRQAYDAGLHFKQLDLDNLTDIYLFIFGCQKQRGYTLSMTLANLSRTIEVFREHYLAFGVYENEKLIAASIAIRVKSTILYNFYCTHLLEFNHLSPVVMLIEGLYEYCRSHQIETLDLGTSAVDNKPNFGLLDFKLRLGAKPTTKLTFEKNLQ